MRALIVDDEQPARERLRGLLSAYPDIEVCGEAVDGEQALEQVGGLRPDLVFLDIQMPGCNGMEVAGALPSPRPKIIFCTAFDQYAVDAFELNAVDYLLKPVNRVRLARALERVRLRASEELDAGVDRAIRSPGMAPVRFLVKRNSRLRVIPQEDAVYFGSEGGLTMLHTADQQYVMDPTLNDYEQRLNTSVFFRISRTVIVNLNWVGEVVPLMGGYGELTLKTGTRLEVSRRRFRELIAALEG